LLTEVSIVTELLKLNATLSQYSGLGLTLENGLPASSGQSRQR